MQPTTTSLTSSTADPIIAEVVRRLASGFRPRQIILFGSRAWGGAQHDSDYDFTIVMPDGAAVARLAADMRLALSGLRASFDLVVVEEGPWRRWARVPVTLEHDIAERGIRVYDAVER